jgi:hypothetical protein
MITTHVVAKVNASTACPIESAGSLRLAVTTGLCKIGKGAPYSGKPAEK